MVHISRRSSKIRVAALAIVLALAAESRSAQPPAPAGPGTRAVVFGKITLRSGEVFDGDVAKELGENSIIRTPDGLRVLPKASIAKAEPAATVIDEPPVSVTPVVPAPRPPAEKAEKSEKSEKSSSSKKDTSDAPPKAPSTIKMFADQRLDEARAGGSTPVAEIAVGGTFDGKPMSPVEAFTISRLTFFLEGESQPRFKVLPLSPPPEKAKAKAAAKSAAKATAKSAAPAAEYIARVTVDVGMMESTFYGTSVLKTVRGQVKFELVRASDKKVIVLVETSEDEGGDPKDREDACRSAYRRAFESLLKKLKDLKTFGGASTGA